MLPIYHTLDQNKTVTFGSVTEIFGEHVSRKSYGFTQNHNRYLIIYCSWDLCMGEFLHCNLQRMQIPYHSFMPVLLWSVWWTWGVNCLSVHRSIVGGSIQCFLHSGQIQGCTLQKKQKRTHSVRKDAAAGHLRCPNPMMSFRWVIYQ
jgi:hypothetical protein